MNHQDTEAQRRKLNYLSWRVIGLCMEVHRELGPGLLESACFEFSKFSEALRELVLLDASVVRLRQRAIREVMTTLREAGVRPILAGETSVQKETKFT